MYTDISTSGSFTEIPLEIDQSKPKSVDGYEITYLFPDEMNLKQQNKITYSLVIEKDSKPVNDLENYVGAKGHSVIIKKGTLEYIHTHPGEAANMSMEGMLIAKWVTQCPLLNKKIK